MHGGERNKKTELMYGGPIDLQPLHAVCDGGHQHKPWGLVRGSANIFATAEERRYPMLLCKRLARRAAAAHVKKKPMLSGERLEARIHNIGQSRRGPSSLVPEYCGIERIGCTDSEAERATTLFPNQDDVEFKHTVFPPGSKVLRVVREGDRAGRNMIEIGRAWRPHEFLRAASKLNHPLDNPVAVPPQVAKTLVYLAEAGPDKINSDRQETIKRIERWIKDLQTEEDRLHQSLHPDTRRVVEGKRILAFKRLLESINYDDVEVYKLLITGIRLVGTLARVGIWRPDFSKRAKQPVESVWHEARKSQKKVLQHVADADTEHALWEETMAEVEAGGLVGPLAVEEVEAEVGPRWVAARRFGIVQSGRLRPIDDFSEFGVNAAFGAQEKIQMKGVDQIVSWTKAWAQSECERGRVQVLDSAGRKWVGQLSDGWGPSGWRDLVGRVADLQKAYKQLPRHPADAALSIIAVSQPERGVKLFKALSLMFGTSAAVYGFLRFSRALAALASELLGVVLVEFFDDFTQIEPQPTSESAQWAVEKLFGLLGWRISESEEKRKPFSKCFVSLGVLIDLKGILAQEIVVANKPGRQEAVRHDVNGILERKDRIIKFREAASLRGRVKYSEGQTFGRVLAPSVRVLSNCVTRGGNSKIDEEIEDALKRIADHMTSALPRCIGPRRMERPVLIFVDGACEEVTSIGAVLFDGPVVEAFGAVVPDALVEQWKSKFGQRQVIGQAEIYPALVARFTWQKRLESRRVIFYQDNESARLALVKGYSPVLASFIMICDCYKWDYLAAVDAWYARVPTHANFGDAPSRLDWARTESECGAKIVQPIWP